MRRSVIFLFVLFGCGRAESPVTTTTTTQASTTTHATATQGTMATRAAPATPAPAAPAAPPVQGRKLQPVDEASQDPSFAAFRAQLLDIVKRRDRDALLPLLDPKIRTNFGGGGGTKDFIREWKLDSPDSKLWSELETILTHGGAFSRGEGSPSFWAPYVYSSVPDSVDAFESLIVLGTSVPLYESPSTGSKVIATLDHDILTRATGGQQEGWAKVKTDDGRAGWVEAREVRSPIGYRAGFAKVGGAWKMNALVAGD